MITANLPGASFDYEALMQEIIETAQPFEEDYIVIVNLNVPDATTGDFVFTLDGAQLSELAGSTGALLQLGSPLGSVRFDADAVRSLADQADGKDVKVTISRVSDTVLASYSPISSERPSMISPSPPAGRKSRRSAAGRQP
jgi:hypothetical protein